MSLRIVPMTEEDYLYMGKEVKDGFEKGLRNPTLISPEVFGSEVQSSQHARSIGVDHRRGYIHLCMPVLNYAVAQSGGKLIASILGVDSELMQDVLSCSLCYDPVTDELVDRDEVEDVKAVLWGAAVVRKWIDDFDVEEAIRETLQGHVQKFCKLIDMEYAGNLRRADTGGALLAGDWRYFPVDDYFPTALLEQFSVENLFPSKSARLSYLINLQGHKERLYAAITEYIAVVPLGMRPDIADRHDKLSHSYAEVISANKNLRMLLTSVPDVEMFAERYRALSTSVYNLMVEPSIQHSDRKSILQRLSSKEGHIRSKMLGKRVDYSGRSVITIDPYLSLRKIKVPRNMLPKLYRSHIFESMLSPTPHDWIGADKRDKCLERLESEHILERVPAVIGRQPTLHMPSMRAFQVEPTDERSIRINPLCVTGFNADFDGDQMWIRVPVSEDAVTEVREFMGIEHNLYYPKNGEPSVMPRQEIIYGLNVCTRAELKAGVPIKTYTTRQDLLDDLYAQRVRVSDTVTLLDYTECAGRVAFVFCLTDNVRRELGVTEITSKTIKPYVERMLEESASSAIDSIDLLVELGFRIGYLYPPPLNLLDGDENAFAEVMEGFHKSMEEITTFYERGMEEQAAYDTAYDQNFMAVEDHVKNAIYDCVGRESGFVRLAESGARGSKSNLVQMYGYKGRIQKSARESFRAVIEHSYTEQLTPLEHFVTAYGGRQGLINKSLNTADTGYAYRKMEHAASPYTIVCDDCGATEGLEILKSDIAMFTSDHDEVNSIFQKIITGRYEAGTNRYITEEFAAELSKKSAVTIRSVLYCKNPCCKKCYGDDPSTHKAAATGLAIGFIAAQSIGEPGTQLSMDSFKKGGVASKTGITSAFDKLEAYIECANLATRRNYGSYDPVAWASGKVVEHYNPDGTKRVKIEGARRHITLPAEAVLKQEAVKGKGLCVERGDYDMHELIDYAGIKEAHRYFLHTIYHIYKDECEISMKHIEVLAASMTMHMVIATDRDDLYVGQYHDTIQLLRGSLEHTVYRTTMLGVKQVQPARPQALSRVLLEEVKSGLASSMLLGLEDPLEYPLNRIMLGQDIYSGGLFEYLEERKS